jgi:hypothetical protein
MSDARTPKPSKPAVPGDRARRRLERAPGDRLRATAGTEPAVTVSPAAAVALAALVALLGGIIVFIVGNLDLGAGLVALSAAVGWTTGLALAEGRRGKGGYPAGPTRMVMAVFLAVAAVGSAFLALGIAAILEGGVLSPIDYLANRFGALVLLDILAAGVAAAIRAR